MKTKLPQVLESKLVSDRTVPRKQLYKAVLADPKPIKHSESTTTNFALGSKLVVHPLERHFEQRWILAPSNQVSQLAETKDDGRFINSTVRDADFYWVESKLLWVDFKWNATTDHVWGACEELNEMVHVLINSIFRKLV